MASQQGIDLDSLFDFTLLDLVIVGVFQ